VPEVDTKAESGAEGGQHVFAGETFRGPADHEVRFQVGLEPLGQSGVAATALA
jgi:hypothetical protein